MTEDIQGAQGGGAKERTGSYLDTGRIRTPMACKGQKPSFTTIKKRPKAPSQIGIPWRVEHRLYERRWADPEERKHAEIYYNAVFLIQRKQRSYIKPIEEYILLLQYQHQYESKYVYGSMDTVWTNFLELLNETQM